MVELERIFPAFSPDFPACIFRTLRLNFSLQVPEMIQLLSEGTLSNFSTINQNLTTKAAGEWF